MSKWPLILSYPKLDISRRKFEENFKKEENKEVKSYSINKNSSKSIRLLFKRS